MPEQDGPATSCPECNAPPGEACAPGCPARQEAAGEQAPSWSDEPDLAAELYAEAGPGGLR